MVGREGTHTKLSLFIIFTYYIIYSVTFFVQMLKCVTRKRHTFAFFSSLDLLFAIFIFVVASSWGEWVVVCVLVIFVLVPHFAVCLLFRCACVWESGESGDRERCIAVFYLPKVFVDGDYYFIFVHCFIMVIILIFILFRAKITPNWTNTFLDVPRECWVRQLENNYFLFFPPISKEHLVKGLSFYMWAGRHFLGSALKSLHPALL